MSARASERRAAIICEQRRPALLQFIERGTIERLARLIQQPAYLHAEWFIPSVLLGHKHHRSQRIDIELGCQIVRGGTGAHCAEASLHEMGEIVGKAVNTVFAIRPPVRIPVQIAVDQRDQHRGEPVHAGDCGERIVDAGRQRAQTDLDQLVDRKFDILGLRATGTHGKGTAEQAGAILTHGALHPKQIDTGMHEIARPQREAHGNALRLGNLP